MKILIFDSNAPRVNLLFNHIKNTGTALKLVDFNLELYHRRSEGYKKFDFQRGNWGEEEDSFNTEGLTICLRHQGDGIPKNLPMADLHLVYSGGGSCLTSQQVFGMEYGIYFPISAEKPEDKKLINLATELLQFGLTGSLPSFIHKKTYNGDLETKLNPLNIDLAATLYNLIENLLNYAGYKQVGIDSKPVVQNQFMPKQAISEYKALIVINEPVIFNPWVISVESGIFRIVFETIHSLEQINKKEDINTFDFAVIPAELVWSKEAKTDYSGIQTAIEIRRQQFAGIILMPSLAPVALLEHLNDTQNTYLDVLRFGFCYLCDISPERDGGLSLSGGKDSSNHLWSDYQENIQIASKQHLQYGFKMSEERLKDVRFYLLPIGKVSYLYHEFMKKRKRGNKKNTIALAVQLLDDLSAVVAPRFAQDLFDIKSQISAFTGDEQALYYNIINSRNTIESYLENNTKLNQSNFGVLLLEDDAEITSRIEALFKKHNIPCWSCSTVPEAVQVLKTDSTSGLRQQAGENESRSPAAFIKVALVDVRLEDAANGMWQMLQGYDFVNIVHNQYSHITCIYLTHMQRMMFRFAGPQNLIWFPKDMALDESSSLILIEKIHEAGDMVNHLPHSALWRTGYLKFHAQPFKVYYFRHRKDKYYEEHECRINECALNLLELWKNPGRARELASAIRDFLHEGDIFEKLTEKKEADAPEELYRLFRSKLAARRAAIAIAAYQSTQRATVERRISMVYNILYFLVNLNKSDDLDSQDLLNKNLGLPKNYKDWPSDNMTLVEERNFLLNLYENNLIAGKQS